MRADIIRYNCHQYIPLRMEWDMQVSVDIPFQNILSMISQMNLKELEQVKNLIAEKELYFKKYQTDDIGDIVDDFKKSGYSDGFLKDLESGLKKSSVYNDN